jgi:anti-sigma regulatory factor (Ser/Thr protein kinase)
VHNSGGGVSVAGGRVGVHDGLLYQSSDEYVDGVLAFLAPALRAGEPMFVAVPAANGDLLRANLPADSGVEFADMMTIGRNPARIIPAIKTFVDAHPRRRVRFVGEPIWPGRSPAEISEATRHEAMLNTVFAGRAVDILCPYDVKGLAASTVANAWRTHPAMVDQTGRRASEHYGDPSGLYDDTAPLLPPTPRTAASVPIRATDLPELRDTVRRFAVDAGLAPDRARELVLAVNEITTNTVMHTDGPGTLRIWQTPHRVICEVRDTGHITDFLAGRHQPDREASRGRGLWMANHLCDLVELRSTEAGTVIRLHVEKVSG